MWDNCQLLHFSLELKGFVAGVRIQICRWIGGWDGSRLERRRHQIIRIEKASWLDQLHQLEPCGREEPPVRHRQLRHGELFANWLNLSWLFDKWRKQLTRFCSSDNRSPSSGNRTRRLRLKFSVFSQIRPSMMWLGSRLMSLQLVLLTKQ